MNCRAVLTTESKDAEAVQSSLCADNVKIGSLEVRCTVRGGKVVSSVDAKSLGTLLSTVDDILRCQITSESMIDNGN